ncbi:unnamed protein product [Oncorhynchus mykiss]|uniref:Fibronectin type-III domain-containing protein n=1 Tax=Oncorhynchus mykiss TaxID=8022 RepID=A0A060XBR4_ONCMY|nr:unnamed protein product [Oncorhynchus mykiss]
MYVMTNNYSLRGLLYKEYVLFFILHSIFSPYTFTIVMADKFTLSRLYIYIDIEMASLLWMCQYLYFSIVSSGALSEVTITGLKPETNYEVKMSAINGKGEGETSPAVVFKTEPVREPEPPKLEGTLQTKGNSLKVNWLKQDDGGSPITHYLVRYKPKHQADWKPEIRLPGGSEYVVLSGLEWNTEYDVFVVAENQQGKSQPGTLTIRISPEPAAIPGTPPCTRHPAPGTHTGTATHS